MTEVERLFKTLKVICVLFLFCHHFFNFYFLQPHLQHMELPRLGVQLELYFPVYTIATPWPDPSLIFEMYTTAPGNAGSFNPLS